VRVNREREEDRDKIKLTEEFVQRELGTRLTVRKCLRRPGDVLICWLWSLFEHDCLRGIWASKHISKFV